MISSVVKATSRRGVKMCGCYCIVIIVLYVYVTGIDFIKYMLIRKDLLDYTNLFAPNDCNKDDKIMYKYFNDKYVKSLV